jgi:hypothetical protein
VRRHLIVSKICLPGSIHGSKRPCLHLSHVTTATWILQAYEDNKVKVSESLTNRTSGLIISFDGWKANNEVLELLGIVAHCLDENYCRRAIVLGVRDTLGSHSGANMADHLSATLRAFSVMEVDYFITNSATNNDKALEVLTGMQPQYCHDKVKQRLRCVGHIYNLVARQSFTALTATASKMLYKLPKR